MTVRQKTVLLVLWIVGYALVSVEMEIVLVQKMPVVALKTVLLSVMMDAVRPQVKTVPTVRRIVLTVTMASAMLEKIVTVPLTSVEQRAFCKGLMVGYYPAPVAVNLISPIAINVGMERVTQPKPVPLVQRTAAIVLVLLKPITRGHAEMSPCQVARRLIHQSL